MKNTLDLWPDLPIVLKGYRGMSQPQFTNNIIVALKHHNRVCDIYIEDIQNTLLKKIRAMKMKDPFPVLTSLRLFNSSQNRNALPLPDSFLGGSAPQLQTLFLYGILFPALPKLLLSTHHLVTLFLWDIPLSGRISPKAIVTVLTASTNLQTLRLGHRCSQSWADRENRLPPSLTRITLPALTLLEFKGDSEYIEDIVGQIDTPLLHQLDITFFNQLIFNTPLLRDFLARTDVFKIPHRAEVDFYSSCVRVTLSWRDGNDHHTLSLIIACRPLDWQLSSLAQVFNSALSRLTFEELHINNFREHSQDDTENAQWLELLTSFISVKDLVLHRHLIELVAPVLEDLTGERVTEVLPALQNLFVQSRQPSELVKKAIGKFVSARRLEGLPVIAHQWPGGSWNEDYVLWEVGDN
jgi:hypothetical protein